MGKIAELAEITSKLEQFIDHLHFRACFVDSRIATHVWNLRNAMRELVEDINELVIENDGADDISWVE
jgi:hypothetical protein